MHGSFIQQLLECFSQGSNILSWYWLKLAKVLLSLHIVFQQCCKNVKNWHGPDNKVYLKYCFFSGLALAQVGKVELLFPNTDRGYEMQNS